MNMPYPSRKGLNEPKGDSEMGRTATATEGPDSTGPGYRAVFSLASEGQGVATSASETGCHPEP